MIGAVDLSVRLSTSSSLKTDIWSVHIKMETETKMNDEREGYATFGGGHLIRLQFVIC